MIRLTRVNHQPLAVNSDLIKFVEQTHDTVLTLINGDEFRRSILVDSTAAYPAAAANSCAPAPSAKKPTEA
jgi:hypothetical protein